MLKTISKKEINNKLLINQDKLQKVYINYLNILNRINLFNYIKE